MKYLYYAEIVARLHEIEKVYREILSPVVGAKDQCLFKEIHEKRMENWDLIKRVMTEGVKDEVPS